jgi:hypothetical protein
MKHAVDSGNGQEQTGQPVRDFHPFKMLAPPPRYKKHSCNVGTWKGCARIFSLCVNKIRYCPKKAIVMKIFISQSDRTFNRQQDVNEKTQIEQRGKLEPEALEQFYLLAIKQNAGQGNYQIIIKVRKVKKLVEEGISVLPTEE